jgi:hypothetical protein
MQLPLRHFIILTAKAKLASHHGGLSTERNRNKRNKKGSVKSNANYSN